MASSTPTSHAKRHIARQPDDAPASEAVEHVGAEHVEPSPDRLVEPIHLKLRFGIPFTRAWLARMSQKGAFPMPVRIGESRIAYIESEIVGWIRGLPRGNCSISQSQQIARRKNMAENRRKRSANRSK